MTTKTVFTTGEAAKICKVSQQTIIRCFGNGSLKGFRVPGSKFRRIPREQLYLFMKDNGIPTGDFRTFIDYTVSEGQRFLSKLEPPYVLKADGLAAGKGVLIIDNLEEAQQELDNMLRGKFGKASAKVVVEGLNTALEAAKPGVTCEAVEAAWRSVIARHGIVKDSRIGYSTGLNYPPDWGESTLSLRPGDKTELRPGMTIHMIPSVWQDDWGVEISECFRVTETGHEKFCDFPQDLVVTA